MEIHHSIAFFSLNNNSSPSSPFTSLWLDSCGMQSTVYESRCKISCKNPLHKAHRLKGERQIAQHNACSSKAQIAGVGPRGGRKWFICLMASKSVPSYSSHGNPQFFQATTSYPDVFPQAERKEWEFRLKQFLHLFACLVRPFSGFQRRQLWDSTQDMFCKCPSNDL